MIMYPRTYFTVRSHYYLNCKGTVTRAGHVRAVGKRIVCNTQAGMKLVTRKWKKRRGRQLCCDFNVSRIETQRAEFLAVSYTHLDVYKRQII